MAIIIDHDAAHKAALSDKELSMVRDYKTYCHDKAFRRTLLIIDWEPFSESGRVLKDRARKWVVKSGRDFTIFTGSSTLQGAIKAARRIHAERWPHAH